MALFTQNACATPVGQDSENKLKCPGDVRDRESYEPPLTILVSRHVSSTVDTIYSKST